MENNEKHRWSSKHPGSKLTIPSSKRGKTCSRDLPKYFEPWLGQLLTINVFGGVGQKSQLNEVPVRFESENEYIDAFFPLLLEEFKEQFCTEFRKAEDFHKRPFHHIEEVEDFYVIKGFSDRRVNDFCLIVDDQQNPAESHVVGMVDNHKDLIVYISDSAVKLLKKGSSANVAFVSNMTSQIRDICALWSIRDNHLKRHILNPFQVDEEAVEPYVLQKQMDPNCSFNENQIRAIDRALSGHAVSLIQGPPGTGKTQTILAILSLLLSGVKKTDGNTTLRTGMPDQVSHAFEEAWKRTRLGVQLGAQFQMARPNSSGRVLICAQSNAAVDELISRIGRYGLRTSSATLMPFCVRIGKVPESVPFSLDNLAAHCKEFVMEGEHVVSRDNFLINAELVVGTLSGSGGLLYDVCSEFMDTTTESALFDFVIVDEAAQALEPTTLIPMRLLKRGGSLIMVGDPKQLPPFVFSREVSKYKYDRSLFARLQEAGHHVTLLTEQYRMHPDIARFPSIQFYDSKLKDGVSRLQKAKRYHETTIFRPYILYDVVDGREYWKTNSYKNEAEVEAVIQMLYCFKRSYPIQFASAKIGIISFYSLQESLLRDRVTSNFRSNAENFDFGTVDSFQGSEFDIVLLSAVRTREIGFSNDVRRLNVAFTRARHAFWVFGNLQFLKKDKVWEDLYNNAIDRKLVIEIERPYYPKLNILSYITKGDEPVDSRAVPLVDDKLTIEVMDLVQQAELKYGVERVTKALWKADLDPQSTLLVLAADADPLEGILHLELLAREKWVPHVFVLSKKALGLACGLTGDVDACLVAIDQSQSQNIRDYIDDLLRRNMEN